MGRGSLKKIITAILLVCFMTPGAVFAGADTLRGSVEQDENLKNQEKLFTGDTEKLEKKDVVKMTVSQVLSGAYSQEGDEFFAEITQEVKGDKGVVIPVGTIAHGTIRQMEDSKRLGRDAWIEMDFDYLITPDGREIPISAHMSSKVNPLVGGAKTVATDLGYTAAGGFVGSMAALQLFGIEGAIASHGYTVAGGAALGGVVGLGMSLFRKGKDVLLSPGDEIKVVIATDIDLPVLSEAALRQDEIMLQGLTVRFTNINYEKDPFGELNTLGLAVSIINATNKNFSSFDMAVMDDMNGVFYPSLFGDSNLTFTDIKSGDRVAGKICFAVNDLKRKHWLVFYDRRTRKPIAKLSIDNAKRDLDKKKTDKKGRKKK